MIKSGKQKNRSLAGQPDGDNLAEIYDTYHLSIYRYIYHRVGEVETARDLTADLFHRLLQAVQMGKGPERYIKSWLYRTAHNIVIDYYRRCHVRRHDPRDLEFTADIPDPAGTAETHILAESARQALNSLTADQCQVISLKFLEGFSNKEAATIMGKSTGAVKSLQHRALTAMRRELGLNEKSNQNREFIARNLTGK